MLKQPLIAVDIGSSAIKVVELTGRTHKKLRAIGLETLPPGVVVDGAVQDTDAAQRVLRDLMKKLKISTRGRRAAISMGGSSISVKKISISLAKESELGEQVFYEAEQHFQHDMADIYFDYWELDPTLHNKAGEIYVLLVGAKRETVEQHIEVVRGAGLRTGVVDCDVFSAANMFEYNYGTVDGLIALVNVGAAGSQVSLMAHGEYLYTRDVPIGGEDYTMQVTDALGVDRENAEALKVSASQGESGAPEDLHKVLGEINEQLVNEIQMTFDYYFQSGEVPEDITGIGHVFMTGGGSRVLGLDAALAAALEIPIHIINPFQRVEVSPSKFQMDYILMQGHLYGVTVGLGMRALNDSN